jgi:thioredoxin reductase
METYEKNILNGLPINCAVNPRTCQETRYAKVGEENGHGRQIVIVGAGPAGLTAARELAARKFKVTALEKEPVPGGQVQLGKMPPHKEKMGWCFEDLEYQAKKNGAEIRYNTPATKELVASYHPYAVIVAAGASAFKPGIPGAKEDYVTTVTPILKGDLKFENKSIAVVGSGMTGIETAEMLVEQGNKVTIIEMADKIAPGAFNISVWDVMERLKKAMSPFMPGRKLESIIDHKLTLIQKNDVREIVYADAIVLSLAYAAIR